MLHLAIMRGTLEPWKDSKNARGVSACPLPIGNPRPLEKFDPRRNVFFRAQNTAPSDCGYRHRTSVSLQPNTLPA